MTNEIQYRDHNKLHTLKNNDKSLHLKIQI